MTLCKRTGPRLDRHTGGLGPYFEGQANQLIITPPLLPSGTWLYGLQSLVMYVMGNDIMHKSHPKNNRIAATKPCNRTYC